MVRFAVNLVAELLTAPLDKESGLIAELPTHRLKTPPTPPIQAFPMSDGIPATLILLLVHLQHSGMSGRRKPQWKVESALRFVESNVFPMLTLLPRVRTLLVMAPNVPKPPTLLVDPIAD